MLKIGKEAKESLIKGINTIADAVKTTMGAEGKTVIIKNKMGFAPHVTKDGVTVAENIELEDSFQEIGASLIRTAARKTVDMVGDGTTTSIVITQELIKNGLEKLEEGFSHVEIREGMKKAVDHIKKEIKNLKKSVDPERLYQIARISANNDDEIGKIVSDAYERIGSDGTIEVLKGVGENTTVKYVEGLSIERGWAIPPFVTDQNTMVATLEDTAILIFDGKISTITEIRDVVAESQSRGRSLLILAEDVDDGVMMTIVKSKIQGSLKVLVCMHPDFGINRKNILEDLAVYTGAEVFNPKTDSKPVLGFAEKIIADKNNTAIIVNNASDNEKLSNRIKAIHTELSEVEDKLEILKLKKRLSNLKNSVAIISVGGNNEIEVKEKYDRIEDSKCAVKSAIEGGYVSGGGSTLLYISRFKMKTPLLLSEGESEGWKIVKKAIQKPFEQILLNANLEKNKFLDSILEYGQGVNVKTRTIENLLSTGVIDSAKVVEASLDNANAIATLVLGTDCIISGYGL